jgi:hypothetical protein
MKTFLLKTHRRPHRHTHKSPGKPHFYILNKGLNSGKPLLSPCPNCFVCVTDNEADKEFFYWLCFGLWGSKSFHYYLKGSVIPFVTIGEVRKLIQTSATTVTTKEEAFQKSIQTLKLIDVNEQKMKLSLKMLDTARQIVFQKLMKEP